MHTYITSTCMQNHVYIHMCLFIYTYKVQYVCKFIHICTSSICMYVCINLHTSYTMQKWVGTMVFLLLYFYYCHLLLYFYCCHLLLYFYYYYLLYFYNYHLLLYYYHLLLYYYHLLLFTTINLFLCRSGWVLWFVLCVHVCMCMSLIICTCANLPYNAGMQGGEVV